LPWKRFLSDRKTAWAIVKPFHGSTNLEILIKVGPVVCEITFIAGRPVKKHQAKALFLQNK